MGIFTYIATQVVAYAAGVAATSAAIAAAGLTWAVSIVSTGLAMVTSRLINGPGARGGGGIQDQGVRVQLPPATENKVPIVYGRAYQQPIITDAQISNDNKTMSYCLVLSERTSTSTYTFNNVYWNDQKLFFENDGFTVSGSLVQTDTGTTTSTNLAGLVKVYAFNGGSSSTYNVGISGGVVPGVDAYTLMSTNTNYAMSDLVFAVVQLTYDSGKGVTALPTMTFDITNNSISNPGDVWYDYMTNTRYGAGISASYLDTDSVIGTTSTSLKSISNQIPTNQFNNDGSTSTQARYTINGVLNAGDTVKNNIDRINLASSSWTTYDHKEGKWRVVVNRAATAGELASAFEFSDDNIIGEINLTSTSLEDLYNSVEIAFANRNARDQSDYYRSSVSSAMRNNLEPDNQLRMRLDLVNNGIQAGRIGLIELLQSRYDLVISFTADYSALVCEVGDIVKVTNPIYDFTEKLFRITRVRETEGPQGELAVEITALQYDADVYTDEQQDDAPDEPNSGITPIISSSGLPAPTNLTATIVTTTVTDFVQISVDIPSTSYPVDMVDVYGKPTYADPNDPYTFITSLVSDQGQWNPGSTATGQVPLITFEPEEYELVAKSVYRNVVSADSVGQLAGLWYATIQPAADADNILLNTTTPDTEFYVASGGAIGTYTGLVADTQLKYVVDINNSGTLYTSALNVNNTLTWNSYAIAEPTGSTSTFLRNDGTWATPAGGGGTGTVTWATLGDKDGASGPVFISLGKNAVLSTTSASISCIAIGQDASADDSISLLTNGSIAIGDGAASNLGGIAIGKDAIAGGANVAIGFGAKTGSGDDISIGYFAGFSNQQVDCIALGPNSGKYDQGYNGSVSPDGGSSIAIGSQAAEFNQYAHSIAIGPGAANSTQSGRSIAIGYTAAYLKQGIGSIALGYAAAYNTQSNYSIAIGYESAVTTQGTSSIAIGYQAALTTQSSYSVAIGYQAGKSSQGSDAIAIGRLAGETNQGSDAVAIGGNTGLNQRSAGQTNQGDSAVAVGVAAGNSSQGQSAVAIGNFAGGTDQGQSAVAIGHTSGQSTQSNYAVAIGFNAGRITQGAYSIAIGSEAGETNQAANSIIINASGSALDNTTTSGLFVAPIRATTSTQVLYYNSSTKEVSYGAASSGGGITQAQAEDIAIIYAIALGG